MSGQGQTVTIVPLWNKAWFLWSSRPPYLHAHANTWIFLGDPPVVNKAFNIAPCPPIPLRLLAPRRLPVSPCLCSPPRPATPALLKPGSISSCRQRPASYMLWPAKVIVSLAEAAPRIKAAPARWRSRNIAPPLEVIADCGSTGRDPRQSDGLCRLAFGSSERVHLHITTTGHQLSVRVPPCGSHLRLPCAVQLQTPGRPGSTSTHIRRERAWNALWESVSGGASGEFLPPIERSTHPRTLCYRWFVRLKSMQDSFVLEEDLCSLRSCVDSVEFPFDSFVDTIRSRALPRAPRVLSQARTLRFRTRGLQFGPSILPVLPRLGILWTAARRLALAAERHYTFPVYLPDVVAQGATDWLRCATGFCQAGSEGLAWLPLAQITLREDVRRIPERGDAASSTFEDLCFRSDFPPMAVAVLLYTGHGTRPRPSHPSCPPTKCPRRRLFERIELYRFTFDMRLRGLCLESTRLASIARSLARKG
ncbi:hypothetical protein C8R46DRAFT_1231245 [Mycena filopes]|nr:hypothetical protein C8R46DRAFT_1231245 [Mycena filopes]